MSNSAVTALEISKRFGETVALNKCSITIEPGEVHAVVGENGSGKSTLAKILSGVLLPDSGKLSVFGGTPLSPIEARALGVATIFQEVLVADELTVFENLYAGADGLWSRGQSKLDARTNGQDMLRRLVGDDVDLDAIVGTLPLSLKQWIVIARSLLSKPKLLILDESSAALDLDATARLHTEIRKLKAEKCCIVIVTHRIAELIKITDRATVLRDGTVVGAVSGQDITEKNLLSLMSPTRTALHDAKVAKKSNKTSDGAVIASAKALVIKSESSAFDFDLRQGEIVGVTGLDGQGHTNFVRVMAGILPSFGGSLSLDSQDVAFISGDRAKEGIFPNLSIFENFALAMYRTTSGFLGWLDRKALADQFRTEVQRFKIKTGPWSNRITSLSGGNQQKVLIGRAFALTPKVIVLDDPARGVDAGTKRELYAELKAFAANGGAVIYLSSEIEEFFGFADRALVFREGTLFDSIDEAEMSEHSILAAMFGQARSANLNFETGAPQ